MAVSFTLRLLDRLAAQGEPFYGRFVKIIYLQILRVGGGDTDEGVCAP